MMQSDLPNPTSLSEAGQLMSWPPVLPTPPGHETALLWRREVRAVLCWPQPIPAGSAVDSPRAKAKPTRHVCCLCENVLRTRQKMLNGRRQTWEGTPERTGRECHKEINKGMRGPQGKRSWSGHNTKEIVAHRLTIVE